MIRGQVVVSPRWEDPQTVAGFSASGPNEQLLEFAKDFLSAAATPRCLDLGCGAARNALPLAALGFQVTGTDLSMPMIEAARERAFGEGSELPVEFIRAPMAPLPFADQSFDFLVAHGIWNLARSDNEFRAAVAEAARVARPGAGLFVFTFSRHTVAEDAAPDAGEQFTFSSWNGEPQCFLSGDQLVSELACAGFAQAPGTSLVEHNRPTTAALRVGGPPVIYEGRFLRNQP